MKPKFSMHYLYLSGSWRALKYCERNTSVLITHNQRRHLGGRRPPRKNEKKKEKEKRKKEKKRKKGTLNSVKLLHIKCCFSNFSIVRWHWNIKKILAPQEKVEMTPLRTMRQLSMRNAQWVNRNASIVNASLLFWSRAMRQFLIWKSKISWLLICFCFSRSSRKHWIYRGARCNGRSWIHRTIGTTRTFWITWRTWTARTHRGHRSNRCVSNHLHIGLENVCGSQLAQTIITTCFRCFMMIATARINSGLD